MERTSDSLVAVRVLAAVALLAAGCAPGRRTQPLRPIVPCAVPGVGSEADPWREVQGRGFAFCIPRSWRSLGSGGANWDAARWEGEGGTVTWGVGSAPPRSEVPFVVPQRANDPYAQACTQPQITNHTAAGHVGG